MDLADDQEKRAYDIINFMNLVSEIFKSGDNNFTKDQMVDLRVVCCLWTDLPLVGCCLAMVRRLKWDRHLVTVAVR